MPLTNQQTYVNEFNDLTVNDLNMGSNYNEICPDHHAPVSNNQVLDGDAQAAMLQLYKDRLRSLKSVDDMVGSILDVLDQYNDDNTYVIFTSDHGYQIGQYAIPCGKMQPYDVTTRIPLYIKGPNIPNGITSNDIVGNMDFLPTMLDLAGISYDVNDYDGKSMKSILFGEDIEWRSTYLMEFKSIGSFGISHCPTWYPDDSAANPFVPGQEIKPSSSLTPNLIDDEDTNNWRVLRIIDGNMDLYYAEFYGATNIGFTSTPIDYEYFDLSSDPYQMNNIYSTLSDDEKTTYNQLLQAYGQCSGADQCSPVGDATPPPYDGTAANANTGTDTDEGSESSGGGKGGKGGKAMKDDTEKYDNYEGSKSEYNVYKVIVENVKDLTVDKEENIYVQIYGYAEDDIKVSQTRIIDQGILEWNDQIFVFDDNGENGQYKQFKFKLYQIEEDEVKDEDGEEILMDNYLGQTDGFRTSDIKECNMDYSKEMDILSIDDDQDGTLFVTIYKDC